MANNIEGSNANSTNNSIRGGNGSALSNWANQAFLGRVLSRRGTNEGGGGSRRGEKGGGMSPEQIDAMGKYNEGVGKQTRKIIKTEGKQTRKTEKARAGHSGELIKTATSSGKATNVKLNHADGVHEFTFQPGRQRAANQGSSQQQSKVKPVKNTKTAADRTPDIVQGPARRAKTPSQAGINRQNAAASSYITPSVKGSPMTDAQKSQNRAARSYITPPNA